MPPDPPGPSKPWYAWSEDPELSADWPAPRADVEVDHTRLKTIGTAMWTDLGAGRNPDPGADTWEGLPSRFSGLLLDDFTDWAWWGSMQAVRTVLITVDDALKRGAVAVHRSYADLGGLLYASGDNYDRAVEQRPLLDNSINGMGLRHDVVDTKQPWEDEDVSPYNASSVKECLDSVDPLRLAAQGTLCSDLAMWFAELQGDLEGRARELANAWRGHTSELALEGMRKVHATCRALAHVSGQTGETMSWLAGVLLQYQLNFESVLDPDGQEDGDEQGDQGDGDGWARSLGAGAHERARDYLRDLNVQLAVAHGMLPDQVETLLPGVVVSAGARAPRRQRERGGEHVLGSGGGGREAGGFPGYPGYLVPPIAPMAGGGGGSAGTGGSPSRGQRRLPPSSFAGETRVHAYEPERDRVRRARPLPEPREQRQAEDRRPGADRSGTTRPGVDRPGTTRPGVDRPGADRPDGDRSGGADQAGKGDREGADRLKRASSQPEGDSAEQFVDTAEEPRPDQVVDVREEPWPGRSLDAMEEPWPGRSLDTMEEPWPGRSLGATEEPRPGRSLDTTQESGPGQSLDMMHESRPGQGLDTTQESRPGQESMANGPHDTRPGQETDVAHSPDGRGPGQGDDRGNSPWDPRPGGREDDPADAPGGRSYPAPEARVGGDGAAGPRPDLNDEDRPDDVIRGGR
ncbi:hypothetical protein ACWDLG_10850 [Nonomuraea sp. NPDC003727]